MLSISVIVLDHNHPLVTVQSDAVEADMCDALVTDGLQLLQPQPLPTTPRTSQWATSLTAVMAYVHVIWCMGITCAAHHTRRIS